MNQLLNRDILLSSLFIFVLASSTVTFSAKKPTADPAKICCTLEKKLKRCCDDQAVCCNEILEKLTQIEKQIEDCCISQGCANPATPITTIPEGGLVLSEPGRYVVCNDLTYTPSTATQKTLAATPSVNFGITISGDNISLDLNNHTYTVNGTNSGAIAIISNVRKAEVLGGTIVGNSSIGQIGIAISALGATVANVAFANIGAAAPAAAVGVAAAGAAGVAAAAAAIVIAPAIAAAATLRSKLLKGTPPPDQGGIILRDIFTDGAVNGIVIQSSLANVIIQNASILNSLEMGISQPLRSGYHGNFLLENILISNSGINGIYTTFNQDNWHLKSVQIRNSTYNGAIFEGFQNLSIQDSQISESGAKGLVASIRQSQNISLSGLEIFNSSDEALRVDNVQNLSIDRSLFTNYGATSLPLVKIQDVNNGLITNCQFMSLGGLADGLFVRNCHGLLVENALVKVFNNFSKDTPAPQPPFTSNPTTGNVIADHIQLMGCGSSKPITPACTTKAPVGINLQGGVTASAIRKTVVSGTPAIGIALQSDPLNGTDEGITLDGVLIVGAQCTGILFSQTENCGVFNSQVVNGQGNGITVEENASQTAIRGNTLSNNRSFGIQNKGKNSQIYQNFASGNGKNYSTTILASSPGAGLGSLENISG